MSNTYEIHGKSFTFNCISDVFFNPYLESQLKKIIRMTNMYFRWFPTFVIGAKEFVLLKATKRKKQYLKFLNITHNHTQQNKEKNWFLIFI